MSVDQVLATPLRVERRTNTVSPGVLKDEVEQFLYRQSECLDTRDWDGWLDLFAPTVARRPPLYLLRGPLSHAHAY